MRLPRQSLQSSARKGPQSSLAAMATEVAWRLGGGMAARWKFLPLPRRKNNNHHNNNYYYYNYNYYYYYYYHHNNNYYNCYYYYYYCY
jgi:hypothetical protein